MSQPAAEAMVTMALAAVGAGRHDNRSIFLEEGRCVGVEPGHVADECTADMDFPPDWFGRFSGFRRNIKVWLGVLNFRRLPLRP